MHEKKDAIINNSIREISLAKVTRLEVGITFDPSYRKMLFCVERCCVKTPIKCRRWYARKKKYQKYILSFLAVTPRRRNKLY